MGGAENLLIGLAGEQFLRGHNVTVAPLVSNGLSPVQEKLEMKGVTVKPLAKNGSVYNPLFIIRIAKILSDYDVVHVHLFPALYWAGLAKLVSFCRKPLVYTEHSTNNKRRKNKLLHIVDGFVYKHCYYKVIACAEKAYETYRIAFPTIDHVCYINNGVDTKVFRDAEPYSKAELVGLAENSFLVTMVARFMPMKRQDTMVEALTVLPGRIHALFVGGEEKDSGLLRVRKLAEEKGVSERAHFLYIRKDVPRILKSSDVILMASDYEGLSLSSIEGMASGKPFVASNVDGLREVVGGAGLLYDNRDYKGLANLLLNLSEDGLFYEEIANKCKERARHYDIKRVVDAYMSIYDEVLFL